MACIEWNYLTPLISCRFLTPSQVSVITAKPLCLNFLKISYKMVMFFIYGWFLFWFWIQMSKLHVETVDHFVHKSAISNDINLHMPDFLSKKFDLMSDQRRIEGCFMMEKLLKIQSADFNFNVTPWLLETGSISILLFLKFPTNKCSLLSWIIDNI